MVTAEEKISNFCQTTQYWEKIDNSLQLLGCEIQSIAYTGQKQVFLNTDIGTMLCQYYQDSPQEYHLWFVSLRTEKFSVKLRYDKVFQWQNKSEDHAKYENALLRVLELATPIPICTDSN
jgi:hypothetical protein